MSSLTGRGVRSRTVWGTSLSFFLINWFFSSLSIKIFNGALIITADAAILVHLFDVFLVEKRFKSRWIKTPRNLAFSCLVLVIKVFSIDSSSLSPLRNSKISCFSVLTMVIGPHTPISQSSAYLTYDNLIYLGFGREDRSLFLSLYASFLGPF